MKYTFVEGSRFAGDPQLIGERVKELEATSPDGVCTSEDYVTDAADETSPLHHTINWDDTSAAWSWRNHQARQVMRSIRIVVKGRAEAAPAFVSVVVVDDDRRAQGYMSSRTIPTANLREQVLQRARHQLNALRRRYAGLEALRPVWDALDGLDGEQKAS